MRTTATEGGALSQRTRDAAREPPEEPRRHGHALALPAPPRLHRGARPRRDHVLGRRAGLPGPEQTSGNARGVRALADARGHADGQEQHEPPVDPHLVARERAGREEGRRSAPTARASCATSRDASHAVREIDDTRLVGDRPPVAHRRAAHDAGAPVPRRARRERVLRLVPLGDRQPARTCPPSTTADLSSYLDQLHAANPDLPLVITEFGAEALALRPGRAEGHATSSSASSCSTTSRSTPRSAFVNGSIHWALRDFRVHQTWQGGAPDEYATPPWHNKSLIEENNHRKPAFLAVARLFRRTKPLLASLACAAREAPAPRTPARARSRSPPAAARATPAPNVDKSDLPGSALACLESNDIPARADRRERRRAGARRGAEDHVLPHRRRGDRGAVPRPRRGRRADRHARSCTSSRDEQEDTTTPARRRDLPRGPVAARATCWSRPRTRVRPLRKADSGTITETSSPGVAHREREGVAHRLDRAVHGHGDVARVAVRPVHARRRCGRGRSPTPGPRSRSRFAYGEVHVERRPRRRRRLPDQLGVRADLVDPLRAVGARPEQAVVARDDLLRARARTSRPGSSASRRCCGSRSAARRGSSPRRCKADFPSIFTCGSRFRMSKIVGRMSIVSTQASFDLRASSGRAP